MLHMCSAWVWRLPGQSNHTLHVVIALHCCMCAHLCACLSGSALRRQCDANVQHVSCTRSADTMHRCIVFRMLFHVQGIKISVPFHRQWQLSAPHFQSAHVTNICNHQCDECMSEQCVVLSILSKILDTCVWLIRLSIHGLMLEVFLFVVAHMDLHH